MITLVSAKPEVALVIAVAVKAVVASCVVFVAAAAVGAVGVPVKAGEFNGAPPPPPLASTKAVVAICVVFVATAAVGATGTPVNVGDANAAFSASNSFNAAPTLVEAMFPAGTTVMLVAAPPVPPFANTNAVVASFVVLSPTVAVGAVGAPVNAGDASGAFVWIAVSSDTSSFSMFVKCVASSGVPDPLVHVFGV